eukprot:213381-Amphidinium_carterae.1
MEAYSSETSLAKQASTVYWSNSSALCSSSAGTLQLALVVRSAEVYGTIIVSAAALCFAMQVSRLFWNPAWRRR